MNLNGLYVPLITPFTASGELAPDALEGLARRVLDDGAAGLVALGTTGSRPRSPRPNAAACWTSAPGCAGSARPR